MRVKCKSIYDHLITMQSYEQKRIVRYVSGNGASES